MSLSRLEKIMAELAEAQKRTDAQFAESDKRFEKRLAESRAESEKRMAESDQRWAKLEAQFARTDKRLDKVAKMVGGMSNNNSHYAEETFYTAFQKIFPDYADKKVIGAIAALVFPEDSLETASRYNLFAVGLQGRKIKILNESRAA